MSLPLTMTMSKQPAVKQAVLDYAKRIGRLEAMPLLALVSLLLSTLFFSGVFGFKLLNLAYIANIANFTMLVSGCLKLRKENVLPLVAAGLSVALSLPTLWGIASFLQQGSEFMQRLQT